MNQVATAVVAVAVIGGVVYLVTSSSRARADAAGAAAPDSVLASWGALSGMPGKQNRTASQKARMGLAGAAGALQGILGAWEAP